MMRLFNTAVYFYTKTTFFSIFFEDFFVYMGYAFTVGAKGLEGDESRAILVESLTQTHTVHSVH
jgi:hypothetical protein